jgi:hypothetical protein
VIIIGSGPSGYSAVIHSARAALRPLVVEGSVTAGGALVNTSDVEVLGLFIAIGHEPRSDAPCSPSVSSNNASAPHSQRRVAAMPEPRQLPECPGVSMIVRPRPPRRIALVEQGEPLGEACVETQCRRSSTRWGLRSRGIVINSRMGDGGLSIA